jgi:cytochrome c peroxidase
MKLEDREAVNRVFVNIGKVLEAYMRKIAAGPSNVDRYLEGEVSALSPEAKRGMVHFTRLGCVECHSGPNYSDGKFHNLGVPAWGKSALDPGRAQGLKALRASPFSAAGPYSDKPVRSVSSDSEEPSNLGAFLTPSLRNLVKTAPYGHNGRFATLKEVVVFHLKGGGSTGFVGKVDPKLRRRAVSEKEEAELVQFLENLEGAPPRMPWSYWIGR